MRNSSKTFCYRLPPFSILYTFSLFGMSERRQTNRWKRFGESESLFHTPAHAKPPPVPITAENRQDYLAEAALFAPAEGNGRFSGTNSSDSRNRSTSLETAERLRVFSHQEKSNDTEGHSLKFKHIARYRPPVTTATATADTIVTDSLTVITIRRERMSSTNSGGGRPAKSSGVKPAFSHSATAPRSATSPTTTTAGKAPVKPMQMKHGDTIDKVATNRQSEVEFLRKSFADDRAIGSHGSTRKGGNGKRSVKVIGVAFEQYPDDATGFR